MIPVVLRAAVIQGYKTLFVNGSRMLRPARAMDELSL
jgi:hypothetical protein